MAVVSLQRARVYGTISGNAPQVKYFPEAASQSFKAGQFVYLSSGKVTACANDATAVLGMAICDATGVTDTSIPVHVINGDTEFEMNVYYDGSGGDNDKIAITHAGSRYSLVVVDNKCYVDISDTTNEVFVVKGISIRDTAGDVFGRAVVDVIPSKAQLLHDKTGA